MSSVQCRCGALVSTQYAAADGSVMCPKCGNQFWPGATPIPMGTSGGYAPMREPNNDAVIGFVLAMVSFVGCIIVAPFAVYFSLRGMQKEENKGLAIAGLIIGILQTVVLIGVMLYVLFIILMFAGLMATAATAVNQAAAQQAASQSQFDEQVTEAMIDLVESEIVLFHLDNGRWPDQTEGDAIVDVMNDGWARPLVYDPTRGSNPVIISLGADGVLGTSDDLESEVVLPGGGNGADAIRSPFPTMPSIPSNSESPAPEAMSLDQAIEALASPDYLDKDRAAEALATMEIVEERRADVVKAIFDNAEGLAIRTSLGPLVKRWATEAQVPLIIEYLQRISGFHSIRSMIELVGLMVDAGWTEELIVLCNHPDSMMRQLVRTRLRADGANNEALVEQCLVDLEDGVRAEHSLKLLKELPVVERLHESLSQKLDPFLIRQDLFIENIAAHEILKRWGPTIHNLDTLIATKNVELLGMLKDQRAWEAIGEVMRDWPIGFNKGAEALREIGPAAESLVWPLLEEGSQVQRSQAILLLGDIGTELSIEKLEALGSELFFRGTVQRAIQEIREAKREPATLPIDEEASADESEAEPSSESETEEADDADALIETEVSVIAVSEWGLAA